MGDKARRSILDNVRNSLDRGNIPLTEEPQLSSSLPKTTDRDELINRFSVELEALGVTCYHERTETAVRDRIRSLIAGKTILSWDPLSLPYRMVDILHDRKVYFGTNPKEVKERAEVGITGVDAAIAETGSLVLNSNEKQPRTASLLPPIHIAIVQPGDIVPNLEVFLALNDPEIDEMSNVTVITGPSRTADIELSITLGVHGPGELIVVIGP
jgi:L-lactate dehydrogenase complex protein LldG